MTPNLKNADPRKWHIDPKIPLGIVAALIIQTVTVIWWAAKLDLRVGRHEEGFQKNQQLAEKVFRLEERITAIHEELNEWEARITHGH